MPLIDSSYFDTSERNVPNTGQADVLSKLNNLIEIREREYLKAVLGYELFKLFLVGISSITPAQRYLDILLGVDFTGLNGRLKRWEGLISILSPSLVVTVPLTSTDDIFFTVGVAPGPAAGDTTYINSSLAGLAYRVTQRGIGPLEPLEDDDSNILTADIQINPTGGFTLLNSEFFILGDKFQIELLSTSIDVSGYSFVSVPDSPIADYVYFWWLKQNLSHTSGLGEVRSKAENSELVSPKHKAVKAWNDMAEKTALLHEFLRVNSPAVYPEYELYMSDSEVRYLVTKTNIFI